MKKIISLVVVIAALAWTWNIVHSSENIGLETHSGIQAKLADLIKDSLSLKKPNAKNLVIQRLWTEALTDNKVRAVFSFKFNDSAEGGEAIEQVIEGEAVLHREPSENSRVDQWTLQSVKTTNDFVTFTEGSLITPGSTSEATQAPVAPAAPAQKNNETPRH